MPKMPKWTHIVVGAGAAGCALAARLSEHPEHRVLLLEEGRRSRDPLLRVPMASGVLLRGERHVKQFQTQPIPGLKQRRTSIPRGSVLGGSTAVNGMIYIRGLASDYDAWAQLGLHHWSYADVLPYFLKSEDFRGPGGVADHHGYGGPLTVSRRARPLSELSERFIDAGLAAGYPACEDFNAPQPEGFGYYHFTIRDGRRATADTFLHNTRQRAGTLDVRVNTTVERVELVNGKARGVVVNNGSSRQVLSCDGEVILCAGVFGSPMILLRSGIGPADELRALGVTITQDAPEVGRNLHDHVLIRVRHQANATAAAMTLHGLAHFRRAAPAFLQAYLFGRGPMNVFPLEAGALLPSPGAEHPDLQANFIPALSSASAAVRFNPLRRGNNSNTKLTADQAGYFASVFLMRPQSRGTIQLRSADPHDAPLLQPNYLAEANDIERLVDGVILLREVLAQAPLASCSRGELDPGKHVRSRQQLAEFVRANADTVHHPVGTCRMGVDQQAVVDAKLRVRGIEQLRVADASVFPSIPSTNTAAAAFMLGERAADFLS